MYLGSGYTAGRAGRANEEACEYTFPSVIGLKARAAAKRKAVADSRPNKRRLPAAGAPGSSVGPEVLEEITYKIENSPLKRIKREERAGTAGRPGTAGTAGTEGGARGGFEKLLSGSYTIQYGRVHPSKSSISAGVTSQEGGGMRSSERIARRRAYRQKTRAK